MRNTMKKNIGNYHFQFTHKDNTKIINNFLRMIINY